MDGRGLLMRFLVEFMEHWHHLLGVCALDALKGLLIGRIADLAGPPHTIF